MTISDEMRIDMMKMFYANGSSFIKARRALQRKYGEKARHVHLKTIQRQITKFERDLTLRRNGTGGGAKTAIVDKNIKKVEKVLEQSPRRSVRTISKRTKLAQTTVQIKMSILEIIMYQ
jgi:transposase